MALAIRILTESEEMSREGDFAWFVKMPYPWFSSRQSCSHYIEAENHPKRPFHISKSTACPAGKTLQYRFTVQGKRKMALADVVDRLASRLRLCPEKIKARGLIIEHVFGTLKCVMNYGYFLMKGFNR